MSTFLRLLCRQRLNLRADSILNTIGHQARHKALPDQVIQLILIGRQALFCLLRCELRHGGANRLVPILRVGTGFKITRFIRQIFLTPMLLDIIIALRARLLGDA